MDEEVIGQSVNLNLKFDTTNTALLHPVRLPPLDDMLITFNLVRPVGSDVSALEAAPRVASQKSGFTLRLITMNWLSRAAVLTRYDQIPPEGFTES